MSEPARPVLGIIACNRTVADEPAQTVTDRYMVAAIRHADAAALLIPARPDLIDAREAVARVDGVLLTGSPSNIEPNRYGASDGDGPFDPGRDVMSLALIEAAIAAAKPVFGICRGFQELNVAFGGTLDGSLGNTGRRLPHHAPKGAPLDETFGYTHEVELTRGGVLATALGCRRLRVNSVHYQGVGRLGEGLSVEAVSEDGVVEAISGKVGGAFVFGVQWHPEWRSEANAASGLVFHIIGKALRTHM